MGKALRQQEVPFPDARSNEFSSSSVSVERVDAFYCFEVSGLSCLNRFRIFCGGSSQSGFSKQTETALERWNTSSRSLGSMMFKPPSRTGSEKISRYFCVSTPFPIRFGRKFCFHFFRLIQNWVAIRRGSRWKCKFLLHYGGETVVVILRGNPRVIGNFLQDVTRLAFCWFQNILAGFIRPNDWAQHPKNVNNFNVKISELFSHRRHEL